MFGDDLRTTYLNNGLGLMPSFASADVGTPQATGDSNPLLDSSSAMKAAMNERLFGLGGAPQGSGDFLTDLIRRGFADAKRNMAPGATSDPTGHYTATIEGMTDALMRNYGLSKQQVAHLYAKATGADTGGWAVHSTPTSPLLGRHDAVPPSMIAPPPPDPPAVMGEHPLNGTFLDPNVFFDWMVNRPKYMMTHTYPGR